jgi:hypothetical protein
MREGCEIFTGLWMEELEKVLIGREDDATPERQLCFEITQVSVY